MSSFTHKRLAAAMMAVCCGGAYLLVAGTQQAAGSRTGPLAFEFGPNDQSYRVLANAQRRAAGVRVAAQVDGNPLVLTDALPERAPEKPADPTTGASRTKLSGVERIRLRVWGNPDFNGEYGIDPDLTLSMPGLGRLDVGNLTLSDLEHLISDRLSSSLRRDTRVSVEVVRARPFFIMGQISRPGAVEWRPGLTLVQALALAGGVTRPGLAEQDTSARALLSFSLTQLSRLKAEKEDVANTDPQAPIRVTADPAVDGAHLRPELARFNQSIIRDEQRAVFQSRIVNLQNEHRSALREIETARAQFATMDEQRSLTRQATKDLEYLKEKQLVANRVYLTQRAELSSIESRTLEINMALERATSRAEGLERQIALAKQERMALLSERIETLEKEVVNLRARAGLEDGSAPTARKSIEFYVARNVDGDLDVAPVTVFGEIRPGDVVIVLARNPGERIDVSKNAMMQYVLEASAQMPQRGGGDASAR